MEIKQDKHELRMQVHIMDGTLSTYTKSEFHEGSRQGGKLSGDTTSRNKQRSICDGKLDTSRN